MQEKSVSATGPDGVKVRATFTRGETDDLVIHMPGFGANYRYALAHRAAKSFARRYGISFATLDTWVALEDYRSLSQPGTTLQTHVDDLKTILPFLQEEEGLGRGRVHVVGHSLSGYPAIMAGADPALDIASVVLWDASEPLTPGLEEAGNWQPIPGDSERYMSTWGMGMVLARSYLDSVKNFRLSDYTPVWDLPTLVVAAGEGPNKEAANVYHQELPRSRHAEIPGSNHYFVNSDTGFHELVTVTGGWVTGGCTEL